MTIYDFMSNNPLVAFLMALVICASLCGLVHVILVYCINRPLRHRNIRLHGWPPEHCDADGDFKEEGE